MIVMLDCYHSRSCYLIEVEHEAPKLWETVLAIYPNMRSGVSIRGATPLGERVEMLAFQPTTHVT